MKVTPTAHTVSGHEGFPINVWDYGGDGPVLLLAHCTGAVARTWDPVVRHLDGYRILAPDTRGHGDSAPVTSREQCAWHHAAGDLLAVLDHFGAADPVYAAGHSAGGSQLAYAEFAQPGTFARLVLLEAIIVTPEIENVGLPLAETVRRRLNTFASREDARRRFAEKPPKNEWSDEALEAYLDHGLAERPDGTLELKLPGEKEAWVYELGGAYDIFDRLDELTVPTLIAAGDRSHSRPFAEEQARRLPHPALELLEDTGHFLPQQRPEAVAGLVARWCR